ncbi:hypothetical protein [Streptomyces sp. NPDC002520]
MHFVYEHGKGPDTIPVMVLHGWLWPGEFSLPIIAPLTDPSPKAATRPTPSTSSCRTCPASPGPHPSAGVPRTAGRPPTSCIGA